MAHLSTLRTRLLLSAGLTALTLTMAATPAVVAGNVHAASACALPLVHDQYIGFHIGVPAGWQLSTSTGAIVISKDAASTETTLVYPALLTQGMTPASFFASYSKVLQQTIAAEGNAIHFQLISKPGQLPRALVTGRNGKVAEQGRAEVLMLHDQTALASEQVVFTLYWAPRARLAADSAMLENIGQCYGPEAGTLYQRYSDQVF